MGLCALHVDEFGKKLAEVADPHNHLHRLLPQASPDSRFLQYIDWYGDTVFNTLQAEDLLNEWMSMYEHAESDAERAVLEEIAKLIRRVKDDIHTYLKFEGD